MSTTTKNSCKLWQNKSTPAAEPEFSPRVVAMPMPAMGIASCSPGSKKAVHGNLPRKQQRQRAVVVPAGDCAHGRGHEQGCQHCGQTLLAFQCHGCVP